MILRFVHGWGFDRAIWQSVTALLPEFDCRCDDRGYFGQPLSAEGGAIVVAHSFGAMRALAEPAPAFRGLVAINGFDCFAARAGFPGVPVRVVERMLAQFGRDPAQVLDEFRRRCGAGHAPSKIDAIQLRADLEALRDGDCRGRCTVPVVSLQAADDPLVPPAMQAAVFASAPRAERVTAPTGGHLLPLSDPAACVQAIRAMVEQS
ncbi:MAG: alpha/beta hydrolase [Sphingomonadales bacterium]|nr:alpha/beta hydrolase [Sphingomonadales bacterium]MBU3993837.1 alpha/beta hydrolase [Alphaproteobacteria bacterium]